MGKNKEQNKKSGGFLGFVAPPSTGWASRRINEAKRKVFEPIAKLEAKEMLPHVQRINRNFKRHLELMSTHDKLVTAGTIAHTAYGILNRRNKSYSFIQKEKIVGGAVGSPEKFVTNFTTGRPSSESIVELSKIKGTTTKVLFDTLKHLKTGRKDLRVNFGFNQKRFCFLKEKFYVTVNDYLKEFGMTKDFKYPLNDDEVAYGLVVRELTKLTILNSDKYLDIVFKIHLINIADQDLSMSDMAESTFSSDTSIKTNEKGKIPNRYQLRNLTAKTSNVLMRNVLCATNARIDMSASFLQNASVAHTFTKKLPAGGIWEFNLEVLCGSGARLDQVYYDSQRSDGTQPSQYGIAIEAVGVKCEGVQIDDIETKAESRFVGTSPGWFDLEVKKQLELVNESARLSAYGGFEASKFAITTRNKDVVNEVDFNIDADQIGGEDSTFYIPIVTSKEERTAGER